MNRRNFLSSLCLLGGIPLINFKKDFSLKKWKEVYPTILLHEEGTPLHHKMLLQKFKSIGKTFHFYDYLEENNLINICFWMTHEPKCIKGKYVFGCLCKNVIFSIFKENDEFITSGNKEGGIDKYNKFTLTYIKDISRMEGKVLNISDILMKERVPEYFEL